MLSAFVLKYETVWCVFFFNCQLVEAKLRKPLIECVRPRRVGTSLPEAQIEQYSIASSSGKMAAQGNLLGVSPL